MTIESKNKKCLSQNNSNSDTISNTAKFEYDAKDGSSEIQSTVAYNELSCVNVLNPVDFKDEIDSCIDPLKNALSHCEPCECLHFQEDGTKSEDSMISEIKVAYECSSEASSAFVSLIELDEKECNNMVKAANLNEFRKANILTLPFKDEYLTVKSIKKKLSSKESESICSSAMRPNIDIDNRFARPAWITGLHDSIGLGAYEWEKMIKSILGQGRYGRNSSRDPFFRFGLPSNLELLQDMTPIIYLERYCNISDRRMALYQKEFVRNREHKGTFISEGNLFKALNNIMVGTLSKEQFVLVYEILELNKDSKIEMNSFAGICALTERLFFSKNLTASSEESYEIQKGYIEMADFMNINYRLKGVKVPFNVEKLIRAI